ncbi:GNAT family N-acetyltransferase [Streptomyces tremellae]|uniref:Acetyltransferase n=1 Tax=Streptomyces tremellae TaxID=1124239 RepID=A0ABP7GF07_9ACTN
MADTDISDDRPRGRLTAREDGTEAGAASYFVLDADPPALVAVHTVVDEAHEGKGIAGALVRHLYRMAAAEGVPVVPLCPYAARWAERHPGEAPEPPAALVAEAGRQSAARRGRA